MSNIPMVHLNNEIAIPQLGLGVWQARGHEVVDAVKTAIEAGYRLIDTAAVYGNEDGVGQAIRESTVLRKELFVTTKLWNSDQGYDNTHKAFEASLKRLGLDYVDLYLIHWPVPQQNKYSETWQAMEEIHRSGRAKAIGVCNFHIEHLEKLLANTGIVPAVNQVELHPKLQQQELRHYCSEKGIKVESWSPIGGAGGDLLDDATINEIAQKHGKSPAQVIIRWHIQLGLIVIPKSVHAERIRQNADVFDFELDDDDMTKIAVLDSGARRGPDPANMNTHVNTGIVQLAHKLNLVKFK